MGSGGEPRDRKAKKRVNKTQQEKEFFERRCVLTPSYSEEDRLKELQAENAELLEQLHAARGDLTIAIAGGNVLKKELEAAQKTIEGLRADLLLVAEKREKRF